MNQDDIIEKVLNKIRKRIEKPNFKSKVEVARFSMKRLLEELEIPINHKAETENVICSNCKVPIEIVLKDCYKKTLRSWTSICLNCLNVERKNYEEKIKEVETDLKALLKNQDECYCSDYNPKCEYCKAKETNKQETKLVGDLNSRTNSSPAPRKGVIEKEIERCATWKCKTKLIIKDKFCMICPKCNREYWRRKWITK